MPDRLTRRVRPILREHEVRVGDRRLRAGMSRPSTLHDGWWLALLWVADDAGVVSFRDVAPPAGPPPEPPLARLGPAFSGALSGFILEDGGRLAIRLAAARPAGRPARAVAVARSRSGRPSAGSRCARRRSGRCELAETVLAAFRRSVESLARP